MSIDRDRFCKQHGGRALEQDCLACSANESVGHPAWPPAKPAPVAPPSQGAEEAWRAFRAKWEDREIHYDSGDKQIFDEGYAAAKEQTAPSGNVCPHVFCSDCASKELEGWDPMAGQAALSEPLSPTTEELRETVALAIGASGYVVEQLAHEALSELARRCPK